MTYSLQKRLAAECVGTAFLLATVIGSGIMAEQLAGGNIAVALLGNTIPTGAILVVLITIFGSISGAHFNPAVSLVFLIRGEITNSDASLYVIAQVIGGLLGMVIAHAMFAEPLVQISTNIRSGHAQIISETVATFGLILTILATIRFKPDAVATMVGLYIVAAYWFTASTSFANPAVTIARSFTDSFAGISPKDALPFIAAQIIGALIALIYFRWQFGTKGHSS